MYSEGWMRLMLVFSVVCAVFCLATATTCTSQLNRLDDIVWLDQLPMAYNNSPTDLGTGCLADSSSFTCQGYKLLGDGDFGSGLDTSKVLAWNREVSIVIERAQMATFTVNQVNLFFYNIPSSGVGLPPVELYWSDANPVRPENRLSHVIVGNQGLNQDDRTPRNVSLVVTNNPANYRHFRIRFTFPGTSLIDWILLSEVQLCGVAAPLPTDSITFLPPPSLEPPVPPGPDSVVSAANLSCTVANEGSFQWQWTLPPGINFTKRWFTDGTRTSIVQISQISAANAGEYTCTASFSGQSANSTTVVQLNRRLTPSSSRVTVTPNQPSTTLSCELYGYLPEQLPTIVWTFGGNQLTDDSVFTITTEDGSHMIQNGGNTPRPSMRSILTINRPNISHVGAYTCSVDGDSRNITLLQMMEEPTVHVTEQSSSPSSLPSSLPSPSSGHTATEDIDVMVIGLSVGLSLGVLLIAAVLMMTVVITILCVQTARKRKVSTDTYEIVGPPQLPPRPVTITTDMNPAYATSIQTQSNAAYTSVNFNAA